MPDVAVSTPVVTSPMVTINRNEEPVLQDPSESTATNEEEQQQPQTENVPNAETSRRSERIRRRAIPDDYQVYNTENFHMEDEMKSMKLNEVWI